MSNTVQDGLQTPGEVSIEELLLLTTNGVSISILDYLVELNIYESVFSNVMTGEIILSDSANLIRYFPITGEEYLSVKLRTPGFSNDEKYSIEKIFRVFTVEDRIMVRDQNTQIYRLKLISPEAVVDSHSILYTPFKGNIVDVVQDLFNNNLKLNKGLSILSGANNNIKFISNGWSPFKCINWLAKKTIPSDGNACNFLFWESNKSFYFSSLETIFENGNSIGDYRYAATSVSVGTDDIEEKMTLITDLKVLNGLDHIVGLDSGYFASKLIALNLYNKKQEVAEYDHVEQYSKYKHTTKENPSPLFTKNLVTRNINSHVRVYPKYPNLHTGIKNNYNERMGEIYSNRLSNIKELDNLKLNIIIHGRTDVEAGQMINVRFPDMEPPSESEIAKDKIDPRYSGRYLITAINHKINLLNHSMSMEVIKDSFDPAAITLIDATNVSIPTER